MKNKLNSKKKIAKMSIKERATEMVLSIPRDEVDNELEHRKGRIGVLIIEGARDLSGW